MEAWQTDLVVFTDKATEVFEEFLESLPTIDITSRHNGDEYETFRDEGFTFVYPGRSSELARRMLSRLQKLGGKYFPGQYFSISTPLWREL